VDEEKDFIDIGKLFLEESRDFFIITIDSALSALAFLNKENFDAIIPGFPIPGMDSIWIPCRSTEKIRADSVYPVHREEGTVRYGSVDKDVVDR